MKTKILFFLLYTASITIISSEKKFTVVTPENIESILAQSTFNLNEQEFKNMLKKKSTTVYLVHKIKECKQKLIESNELKVIRHGRTVATYNEIIPTETNTNTNLHE